MQRLLQLYKAWSGNFPAAANSLPKAGSNRHYVRLSAADGSTAIGVISPDVSENRCFIYLSRHFAAVGLPVPAILAVSPDSTAYLQTDLGTTSLYQELRHGRESGSKYNDKERSLIAKTLRMLPHLQVRGAVGLDVRELLSPRSFNEQAAMFDLNYFKYCFLRTADLAYDEVALEEDLHKLASDLVAPAGTPKDRNGDPIQTFLYRDFQARNVMLCGENAQPHFIDYQGGQIGPLQYDLASFLWQASARYPQTLREALIDIYLDELCKLCSFDEEAFRNQLHLFVLFRILQVLGAYGLRGYFERKQYFIDSIPPAIQNLRRQLLDGVCTPYAYLEETLQRLVDLPRFELAPASSSCSSSSSQSVPSVQTPEPARACPVVSTVNGAPLVVRIYSFSYKKGIPADPSGNGGGYVFDCRSTHNPGRYEAYKTLTGLDAAVIRFLEEDGEITRFLRHVYALADAHVARYVERGFTSLVFCFGCTGGQHRSVYSAQHLAEHLHCKFKGIEVRLCHREQGIDVVFPAAVNNK